MSAAARIAIVVLVLVVAVAGFVVLRPDDDDGSGSSASTTTAPVAAQTAPVQNGARGATGQALRAARPRSRPAAPPVPEIVVRAGAPVGGVEEIELRKGERIRFTVVADAPDEVHLHGYDVEQPAAPGRPARFDVPAELEGIFEVELHHSGAQIASVTVEP